MTAADGFFLLASRNCSHTRAIHDPARYLLDQYVLTYY